MSTAPVGVDSTQYSYGVVDFTPADNLFHTISAPGWLVTRVQVFNGGADVASIQWAGAAQAIQAGGCLEMQPGGTWRTGITVFRLGCRFIVEYWWKATESGIAPSVTIT